MAIRSLRSILLMLFAVLPMGSLPILPATAMPGSSDTSLRSAILGGAEQQEQPSSVSHVYSIDAPTPQQNCTAAPPTLIAPIQGAISNDLENPRYTWSLVPGVREFIFQLSQSTNFDQPITTDSETVAAGKTQVIHGNSTDLDPNTTYYWRVASVCDNGQIGAFGAPASFSTGSGPGSQPCTLPPPTLLAPANTALVTTLVPQITWNREPNTFEYYYELSRDSSFSSVDDRVTFLDVDPDLPTDLIEIPDENLVPNTTYYWRVASICAEIDAQGAFSAPFSFRTSPLSNDALPPATTLIAPVDRATTGSIRVTILFDTLPNVDAYRVLLYRTRADAEANDWFRALGTSTGSRIVVENPNETFFWRVRARNDFGWGTLSPIRSFTTPAASANATITPEAGGALQPSPGYLTVNFPPGAVTANTRLNFTLLANPRQRLPNFRFANRAFTLEAFAGTEQIMQFARPFTMTVRYDSSDLLAAGIADATQLTLVFWNGQAWENIFPCAGCTVDTANQRVTVVIDHLTEFALVAPGQADTKRVFLPALVR